MGSSCPAAAFAAAELADGLAAQTAVSAIGMLRITLLACAAALAGAFAPFLVQRGAISQLQRFAGAGDGVPPAQSPDAWEEGAWDLPPELEWRVARARLTESWLRGIKKRKPRFLDYDEAVKWVAAMGQWDTREDWEDWIERGEKRNPYLPSDPITYYTGTGDWISWEHFLSVDDAEAS